MEPGSSSSWQRHAGLDPSLRAGQPAPTEDEIDNTFREDLTRRAEVAKAPERTIESVWAFFAHCVSRGAALMHGTVEVKSLMCDVPICHVLCSRMATSMLAITGHLPRTQEALRELAEMPHPPPHHPR